MSHQTFPHRPEEKKNDHIEKKIFLFRKKKLYSLAVLRGGKWRKTVSGGECSEPQNRYDRIFSLVVLRLDLS
jgi:hypothetical protein